MATEISKRNVSQALIRSHVAKPYADNSIKPDKFADANASLNGSDFNLNTKVCAHSPSSHEHRLRNSEAQHITQVISTNIWDYSLAHNTAGIYTEKR